MKLSVHLVTWNGAKYIPYLFDSLRAQTFKDWSLFVLDNNSSDNTAELIEKELNNFPVPNTLTINLENKGFAGGHNQLFSATRGEYFVLLNQDFYLDPHCLEILMEAIEEEKNLAVVGPRLMKWNFAKIHNGLAATFTNVIDSLGLRVFRNRRVVEIGAGETWNETEQKIRPVFGVSGAMPLFRRSVIERVAFSKEEFFDNLYGSYKEDVDLAFRLQSAGFTAAVVTAAVTYHDRGAGGPARLSDAAAAGNKKQQSHLVQYHSYKNHLLTLYKNEYWQNGILDFPWILWYELKKFMWFLFFNPKVLLGLKDFYTHSAELRQKKRKIYSKRTVRWSDLRVWWT